MCISIGTSTTRAYYAMQRIHDCCTLYAHAPTHVTSKRDEESPMPILYLSAEATGLASHAVHVTRDACFY